MCFLGLAQDETSQTGLDNDAVDVTTAQGNCTSPAPHRRSYQDVLVESNSDVILESGNDSDSTSSGVVDEERPYVDTDADWALFSQLQWIHRNGRTDIVLPDPSEGPIGPECRRIAEDISDYTDMGENDRYNRRLYADAVDYMRSTDPLLFAAICRSGARTGGKNTVHCASMSTPRRCRAYDHPHSGLDRYELRNPRIDLLRNRV